MASITVRSMNPCTVGTDRAPRSVGMTDGGRGRGFSTSVSIRTVCAAWSRGRWWRLRWWTTSSRTGVTPHSSGTGRTGRAYVSRVMTKRHGTRIPTRSTDSDGGGGGVKSPEPLLLKTDGPLCVNFRRIKQGGYIGVGGVFAKCNQKPIPGTVSLLPENIEKAYFKRSETA